MAAVVSTRADYPLVCLGAIHETPFGTSGSSLEVAAVLVAVTNLYGVCGGEGAAVAADRGSGDGISHILLGNVSGDCAGGTVAPLVGVVAATSVDVQYCVEGDRIGTTAINLRRLGDGEGGAGNFYRYADAFGTILAVGYA